MEFAFPISKALDLHDGFALINTASLDLHTPKLNTSSHSPTSSSSQLKSHKEHLTEILDVLGKHSCKAQGQKHPVTTYSKFITSLANRMYIKADQYTIYGFLRVETKKIAYKDPKGIAKESKFVCALDFYVHESVQRGGVGKAIFDKMLKIEQLQACKLAYKKPSIDVLSFLKKHYGLTDPTHQPNNYVIFSSFWTPAPGQFGQFLSPYLDIRRETSMSNRDTESPSRDTLEEPKEEKLSAFDLKVIQNFEKEKPKQSTLIDLLLKAPSVLENNIFTQLKGNPPESNEIELFENEGARRFYSEVYKWHWNLEKEIGEEIKYLKGKGVIKEAPEETI